MLVEIPVHIHIEFRIKPDHLHDANLNGEISQQLFILLDEFYPKYLKQLKNVALFYYAFANITESSLDNLRFDLRNMKAEINIPYDGSVCSLSTNMKIIYEDSNPPNDRFEGQLIQATQFALNSLHWDSGWGTSIRAFSEAKHPIFQGEPSYTFTFTAPEVINIQGRTRRRAIQGIRGIPQNEANRIANFAVGPLRNIPNRHRPLPEALSNTKLYQTFESRLDVAEEARAAQAARNLEATRQASAAAPAAQPQKKKPWWNPFGGKRQKTRKTLKKSRKTRKTRDRRRA